MTLPTDRPARIAVPPFEGELGERMGRGLDAVEVRLLREVRSDHAFIAESSRHLVDAGGKRFRPLLTLLAAQFGDDEARGVVPSAVVVELTHLATLYHDDVMDEATLRRGAPSANARYGNAVAILTGDFLFARASNILADLGPDAVRLQARTFERLVTGQIRETVGPGADEDPVAHHLAVLADKTGSLIATSARFGALQSGASADVADTLTTYGELVGVAFQLADDLLDIAADGSESGKAPGTDLREGVATLPVLLLRRMADPDDATDLRLLSLLSGDLTGDAALEEALSLMRGHRAMDEARAELRRWAGDAKSALAFLPDIEARGALEDLCDVVVTRTH